MDNKISIIIPAYNIAQYLPATLDSVLGQTYRNLEVIVVNDGSTDRTGAIIDAYAAKDPRVKAIHKENGGVTSARLCGVAQASGEWIGFVDGDDYIEPDMYEKLLSNALKYEADISHCGYRMVFPNGRVDYYYNTGRLVQQDNVAGLKDLIAGQFVEPGLVNKLFRRKLFSGLDGYMDRAIKINEDLLMNYWLFKSATSAVYEDICPYYYILRKGSAATSQINVHKLWDPLHVAHAILEDAPEAVRSAALEKLARLLIAGATMEKQQAPELIAPYRKQTRKELRQRLPELLRGTYGAALKLQLLWTAVWPASYSWVHALYAKLTGLDKIYDLD